MSTREIAKETAAKQLLAPAAALSADATSAAFDTAPFRAASIIFNVGATAGTLSSTNNIALEVQESDDDSTYTAVSDDDLTISTVATNTGTAYLLTANADVSQAYIVGYTGTKRYLKGVVNFGGTTQNTAVAILGLGSLPLNSDNLG